MAVLQTVDIIGKVGGMHRSPCLCSLYWVSIVGTQQSSCMYVRGVFSSSLLTEGLLATSERTSTHRRYEQRQGQQKQHTRGSKCTLDFRKVFPVSEAGSHGHLGGVEARPAVIHVTSCAGEEWARGLCGITPAGQP